MKFRKSILVVNLALTLFLTIFSCQKTEIIQNETSILGNPSKEDVFIEIEGIKARLPEEMTTIL